MVKGTHDAGRRRFSINGPLTGRSISWEIGARKVWFGISADRIRPRRSSAFPSYSLALTVRFNEWLILPRAAINFEQGLATTAIQHFLEEYKGIIARQSGRYHDVDGFRGVDIDGSPEVSLLTSDEQFRRLDCDFDRRSRLGSNNWASR